jgi:hypothetical protein
MVLRGLVVACAAGLCAGLGVSGAALAHHSRAPYDLSQEIVVEGTVTALDWKNPHIYVTVETAGPDGTLLLQEIELLSVSEARASGLRQEAIAPGSHVVVRARPGRRGAGARALGLTVATSDGAVLPLNTDAGFSAAPAAATEADGIAGRWAPSVSAFGMFFNSATGGAAAAWPLTDAGRASQAETFSGLGLIILGVCEPFPPPWLTALPVLRTIDVGETTVLLHFDSESGAQERVVHLDQLEHPADLAPSVQGHSIGRWEGETLVIDTVGFVPHALGLGVAPSTPDKRLVERLTLAEDRRHLRYEMTIEDPARLAAPASLSMVWDYRPDLEPSTEGCDPEIARRTLDEELAP